MTVFDSFAMVDWSGGKDTGAKPKKDAIWAAVVSAGRETAPVYLRNRSVAFDWLAALIESETAAGRRLMIGFDFPFGYPAGFARAVTGSDDPLRLWDFMKDHLKDGPDGNSRFALAGRLNAKFPGVGPFWFNGTREEIAHLPRKGTERTPAHGLPERRDVEVRAKGSFTCWQMGGAGAVGGQVMTGMATLARLRERFGAQIAVWPFEALDRPVAFVEIWPSLIDDVVRMADDEIRDSAQVRCMARALSRLEPDALGAMLDVDAAEEGWILGVGHEDILRQAALGDLSPPRLSNDCFALPPGVEWTPVETALERLKVALTPVVGRERKRIGEADGRILAGDVRARRAHPPAANSAVDGYGFAQSATGEGPQRLPLAEGRAAAGAPFEGEVPEGQALRILTGALVPDGVDTVILEEDVASDGASIAFHGPIKRGANVRRAGEDVEAGEVILRAGTHLGAPEIGLLAATGSAEVEVFTRLRVGVLSTGDELARPGETVDPARTYDANRPMLLALLRDWNIEAVDLGHAPDDRKALKNMLDMAAGTVDAILTSGGASAGDEDHVSALLGETGSRVEWRIALKPGRPLALGVWEGVPVFGLPGNPVAALVCTLIFARPALGVLRGEAWKEPVGFMVPAAFSKSKKPGRREYLRARMGAEGVEVFASEGSGRISGLAWADGLVELPDEAQVITPGTPVRFIPYGSFR